MKLLTSNNTTTLERKGFQGIVKHNPIANKGYSFKGSSTSQQDKADVEFIKATNEAKAKRKGFPGKAKLVKKVEVKPEALVGTKPFQVEYIFLDKYNRSTTHTEQMKAASPNEAMVLIKLQIDSWAKDRLTAKRNRKDIDNGKRCVAFKLHDLTTGESGTFNV